MPKPTVKTASGESGSSSYVYFCSPHFVCLLILLALDPFFFSSLLPLSLLAPLSTSRRSNKRFLNNDEHEIYPPIRTTGSSVKKKKKQKPRKLGCGVSGCTIAIHCSSLKRNRIGECWIIIIVKTVASKLIKFGLLGPGGPQVTWPL